MPRQMGAEGGTDLVAVSTPSSPPYPHHHACCERLCRSLTADGCGERDPLGLLLSQRTLTFSFYLLGTRASHVGPVPVKLPR